MKRPENLVRLLYPRGAGWLCLYRCMRCGAHFQSGLKKPRMHCSMACTRAHHSDRMTEWGRKPHKYRHIRRKAGESMKLRHAEGRFAHVNPAQYLVHPNCRTLRGCCKPKTPDELKANRMTRAIEKAKRVDLTPSRMNQMRREIAEALTEQLADAHEVVMGTKSWSPTQARVFSMFLNKVVPDLHTSFGKDDPSDRPLAELSRAELEAIVAKTDEIEHEPHPSSSEDVEDAEIIGE